MKNNRMNNFHTRWYKKWWVWVLIVIFFILICLIITAPYIINILVKKHSENVDMSNYLNASDVLSYIGAILGFLGSVIFSALALWQNHRLHQINSKILENEHRYSLIPQFEISNITVSYYDAFLPKEEPAFIEKNGHWETEITTHFPEDQDCEISLVIELKNVGDGLAKNLKVNYIDPHVTYDMLNSSKDNSIWAEEEDLRYITKVGQIAYFNYPLPLLMASGDNDNRSITLEYKNLYDYKYLYFLNIDYSFIEPYRFKISVNITNYDMF